jgi:hypothetical protein
VKSLKRHTCFGERQVNARQASLVNPATLEPAQRMPALPLISRLGRLPQGPIDIDMVSRLERAKAGDGSE